MAPGGHGPSQTMSVVGGTADLFRSEADVASWIQTGSRPFPMYPRRKARRINLESYQARL
jgi:hypothetical protein